MHPQEKVQAELDSVLGPNHLPTMQDKPFLPYTEVGLKALQSTTMNMFLLKATLMEVQRISNIALTGLFHAVTRYNLNYSYA